MNKRFSTQPRSLYRSRGGWIFGVCQGIADYSEIGVTWVRLAVLISTFLSGFWPMVIIYIVAAIFLRPAPTVALESPEDWEFYNSYATDRKMALNRLKQKFDTLERRTRRIEDVVTDPEFQWERKMES